MKEERIYSNIFYFRKISKIGGTEQFLYEIAKKYHDIDITIFYDEADEFQLKRLRKYVRCKKRKKGETVKCSRAFFNFNIDMIDDVEADEYYFVSHANYEELHRVHGGYIPPIRNKKLTHYIGVSQFSTDKLDEYAKLIKSPTKTKKCYNPLTLEPKEKVMIFVAAARLDDEVKGGERIQIMIEALDRYCEKTERHYLFLIFSNPNVKAIINSQNVVLMKPRVDVRPYIAMADYVIHLPNDMETYCYTINEALGYGVPIVTTPLSILNELPIDDNMKIVCNYDMSNVDEVVEQIFNKEVKPIKYNIPEDDWGKLLLNVKSNYEEEKNMKYLVEATDKYQRTNTSDNQRSEEESKKQGKNIRYVPKAGESWIVDNNRKETLVELGFVKVVKEIEEVIETAKKEINTEKAVKKTTKKNK